MQFWRADAAARLLMRCIPGLPGQLAAALAILLATLTGLAHGAAQETALERELQSAQAPPGVIMLDGKELFRVKGTDLIPAERRARLINERLVALAEDESIAVDALRVEDEGELTHIVAGELVIMVLADFDTQGMPRRRIAEVLSKQIGKAVEQYRHDRTPRVLLANTGIAAATTLLAGALFFGLLKLRAWVLRLLRPRFVTGATELKIQSIQLVQSRQLWFAARGILNATFTLSGLMIAYLYFSSVLRLYPWTRPLADQLFMLFLQPLEIMGKAVLAAIPDLTFVLVLILIARYALRALQLMFQGIEHGAITFEGFDREWAQPTYKIVRILVVAFTVVVAYPYIPGSDSQAFKGVSLFLGVIFSLGSSSVISNVIAGYTMTYRRAFRIGDRIKVGDTVGFVTEMSVLVTRVRSVKNEEVVLPNSEILNNAVINYSTLAQQDGLILHTTVGIGYETPWRQVEAMLLMAADRCRGLKKTPPPFVLQQSLGDFCIVYEINAYCTDPAGMGRHYSELHGNILDVFNEYGVQIMTPAYEGDPETAKVVPREQWLMAPARPDGSATPPGPVPGPRETNRAGDAVL